MIDRPRLAAAACALIVSAWGCLAAWIFVFVLFLGTRAALLGKLVSTLMAGFVLLVLAGILLGAFVRCPDCHRRLLLRGRGERSVRRARFRQVDSWASAVVEVLVDQACHCIYCARKVAVPWR